MRAILSVSDKTGIIELARFLEARGYELISSGGTHRHLQAAGIRVLEVSQVTGMKEMLGGRVKTLHPTIHGGILARRGNDQDLQELREHDIRPIDLVVVNLYPFIEGLSQENDLYTLLPAGFYFFFHFFNRVWFFSFMNHCVAVRTNRS